MDEIITDIARGLDPTTRETLNIFRTSNEALAAGLADLPMGFLELSHFTEDHEARWVLSDFGRKVANASAALTAKENAA